MILLLLGTHEQPFERALDRVLPLAGKADVVVQHGHTPRRDGDQRVTWVEFAPYDRIVHWCRNADAVICHAGVGTIMTARAAGKTPLVIPRRARYGEHVDDHQLQIAGEFVQHGLVAVLEEDDQIEDAIADAAAPKPFGGDGSRLRRAVAEAVG